MPTPRCCAATAVYGPRIWVVPTAFDVKLGMDVGGAGMGLGVGLLVGFQTAMGWTPAPPFPGGWGAPSLKRSPGVVPFCGVSAVSATVQSPFFIDLILLRASHFASH